MNKIKNIVFDLGNVLITFTPLEFLYQVLGDRSQADRCYDLILQSPEWHALDRGQITTSEAKRNLKERDPSLAAGVDVFYDRWMEMFHPIEDNVRLLNPLKQRGYRLFVLSNIIQEVYDVFREQLLFLQTFDGIVASCELGISKPDPAIYHYVLETYNLSPDETLFIDDMLENVEEARHLGISTIHFNGSSLLQDELIQRGIL